MANIIGWLIIPAISLYAPIYPAAIVNGYHDIGPAINHLEGTTWVSDEWGRVVLGAHNPGWFANLDELEIGDRIIIVTPDKAYEFVVSDMTEITNDRSILAPTDTFTLTLLTCRDRGVTWWAVNAQEKN